MGAQEIPWLIRMRSCVRNGVELMVAHHDISVTSLDHTLGNHHRIKLSRSTINQVANKNCFALRMLPRSINQLVIHLAQKTLKFVGVSMNIADDVVPDLRVVTHMASCIPMKLNGPRYFWCRLSRYIQLKRHQNLGSPDGSGVEELQEPVRQHLDLQNHFVVGCGVNKLDTFGHLVGW